MPRVIRDPRYVVPQHLATQLDRPSPDSCPDLWWEEVRDWNAVTGSGTLGEFGEAL